MITLIKGKFRKFANEYCKKQGELVIDVYRNVPAYVRILNVKIHQVTNMFGPATYNFEYTCEYKCGSHIDTRTISRYLRDKVHYDSHLEKMSERLVYRPFGNYHSVKGKLVRLSSDEYDKKYGVSLTNS
jgi:hypothetical protein